jgi:3-oxoadipate enol-lactonase
MTATETGMLRTDDGIRIGYSIDGDAGLPWLVLGNSLATDRRMWEPQMAAFTNIRRVLRFDARGHGESGIPAESYGFDRMAADVLQLMNALQIDRTDFAGVSMGGMTGLATAIAAPERIGKLVCADARADAPDPYKAIWDGNIAKLRESGMAALAGPTMERWFTRDYRSEPANASMLGTVHDMITATPASGYELAARCLQSLDLLGSLGRITCPVLYITGEHDPAAPVPVMTAMADATPDARLEVIANAAHLSNIEQPEAFAKLVVEFLGPTGS